MTVFRKIKSFSITKDDLLNKIDKYILNKLIRYTENHSHKNIIKEINVLCDRHEDDIKEMGLILINSLNEEKTKKMEDKFFQLIKEKELR